MLIAFQCYYNSAVVLFNKGVDTLPQHNNDLKKTVMNSNGKSSTIGSLGMKLTDLQGQWSMTEDM